MALNWLQDHVNEFILPHAGRLPGEAATSFATSVWKPVDLKALSAIWREAKKRSNGRTILLAGRDVFLFEAMARMEDVSTIFRPDISSFVAPIVKEDYRECYLLDTGFRGSVPKAMKMEHWDLIKLYVVYPAGMSTGNIGRTGKWAYTPEALAFAREFRKDHQVFPDAHETGILSCLASKLEGVAKYWYAGERHKCPITFIDKPTPQKMVSADSGFLNAAAHTIHVIGTIYNVKVINPMDGAVPS